MTTYLLLALGVLVPVGAVSLVVLVRAGRPVLLPALAALAVLLVLTACFDSVIVGLGIVGYDGSRILGLRVGAAPVEDFAYPVAAALGIPALWTVLGAHRRS
ncbi:lycopene cyclase domain-containing protein [Amnibacterium sp. CER49]|uniref:lycopene cyclase domain-containing protein n=1 Tax=Amnibacterium sp. CER49 TaxID=3039161 RepID=UPI00244B7A25|nr:lycopene cyclase domain-containing protein [Amnibacterium sp. CER49]MDH2443672.1 lycopene cyclase domain-containing protein [Amnibacterium sp. CER49]